MTICRPAVLLLCTASLAAQFQFATTRHSGLPPLYVGDKFAAGDLDGDGDIDLFVANDNSPNQLLLNDGNGRFTDATVGRFVMQAGPNASHSVDLADIDADRDLDILIGNDDFLSNRVYVNNGAGFFTDVTATALPPNQQFTESQVVADFDGDADVDWFTVDGGLCHYYVNNGSGVFSDQSATRLVGLPLMSGNRYAVTPFARDVDLDGDLDVLIPAFANTSLFSAILLLNQGGVLSMAPSQLPQTQAGSPLWFADVDNDGDPDVFGSGGRYLLQNQGNGTFVDISAAAFGSSPPTNGIASFDVDGDGDTDLLTTSAIWLNQGSGTFTAQATTLNFGFGYNSGVASADFDGDGDVDLTHMMNLLRQVRAPVAPQRGSNYAVNFHTRPGATTVLGAFAALAPGQIPLAGIGMLQLDPATVTTLTAATVTGSPRTFNWPIPNVAALAGTALHYQGILLDPLAGPVLTNTIRDVVQ